MAKQKTLAPVKLQLLVTVTEKAKAEYYADLIQSFDANLQVITLAKGTAERDVMNYLGLSESEKTILFSVVREDRLDEICERLDEKFRSIKNGKGIAVSLPLTSVIGKLVYAFLANEAGATGGNP